MYRFLIHCPNQGLSLVMRALSDEGIRTESRNGPVIRFPKPVCLEYPDPRRRLLTSTYRAANHFFHLFETMWMLAGSDLVQPLDLYNSGMKQYSDDGVTFAAPYGYRWRKHFGYDQLVMAIDKLKKNPEDRRIVIQMWDPQELRKESGKDFACNQQILLDTRPNPDAIGGYELDMTVTNRSNDLIYGAMGSNLYHFSFLHEWLALHAGLGLGTYFQISKNMHLYLENEVSQKCWDAREVMDKELSPLCDTTLTSFGAPLLMPAYEAFVNQDLKISDKFENASSSWLERVALPVCEAYRVYKHKDSRGIALPLDARVNFAKTILETCESDALRNAGQAWLTRVQGNAAGKKRSDG